MIFYISADKYRPYLSTYVADTTDYINAVVVPVSIQEPVHNAVHYVTISDATRFKIDSKHTCCFQRKIQLTLVILTSSRITAYLELKNLLVPVLTLRSNNR